MHPTVLEHAKQFDVEYIQSTERVLYCSNETLIKDYIFTKTLVTNLFHSVILTSKANAPHVIKQAEVFVRTHKLDKWIKARQNTTNLHQGYEFRNASTLHIAEIALLKGFRQKIDFCYVTNCGLTDFVMGQGIPTVSSLLKTNGRITLNFDL
jgi:hypothetical protein